MNVSWCRRCIMVVCIASIIITLSCGRGENRGAADARSAIEIEPDITIGLEDGDSAYLFGDIVSVAVDEVGRTYVGDRIGATIRIYDGGGQYIKRIARAGGGPGEIYGWPADITLGPDGRIYVRDGSRVTIFAPTAPGGVADSVAEMWSLPGYGNLSSTRSRVGDDGTYLYPGALSLADELPRFFYLPFQNGVPTGDTLELPGYPGIAGRRRALYRLGKTDGRLVDGLSHVPFAALPAWDVTRAGTILSSSGRDDRIIETGVGGDTIRAIEAPAVKQTAIPPRERLDSARALDERLDSLPVPVEQVVGLGEGVRERRLPATLPPIVEIHVASDGSIWVERWPPEGKGQARLHDVLDVDGRFRTRIVLLAALASDPPPYFGAKHVVGVIRDPETGVERVVRFTLPGNR
jgi:hypothetical protein